MARTRADAALFDADEYLDHEPVVGVVPQCIFCGAVGDPIPSDAGVGIRTNGWWPGVAFAILALTDHRAVCPALNGEPLSTDENRHPLAP